MPLRRTDEVVFWIHRPDAGAMVMFQPRKDRLGIFTIFFFLFFCFRIEPTTTWWSRIIIRRQPTRERIASRAYTRVCLSGDDGILYIIIIILAMPCGRCVRIHTYWHCYYYYCYYNSCIIIYLNSVYASTPSTCVEGNQDLLEHIFLPRSLHPDRRCPSFFTIHSYILYSIQYVHHEIVIIIILYSSHHPSSTRHSFVIEIIFRPVAVGIVCVCVCIIHACRVHCYYYYYYMYLDAAT